MSNKPNLFKSNNRIFNLFPGVYQLLANFNPSGTYPDLTVGKAESVEDGSITMESLSSDVKEELENVESTANEAKEIAEDVETRANDGEFNGQKGDPGKDGFSPIVEIAPRENSNMYQMIKNDTDINTIRWCDGANNDTVRTLIFSAKVYCKLPYFDHSFRIQVRKQNGTAEGLIALGSDGAGNTVVYAPNPQENTGVKVKMLNGGWHFYEVTWNQSTGEFSYTIDGALLYSSVNESLIIDDANGLQVNAWWQKSQSTGDYIEFDYFTLYGDGVLRFDDDFNNVPIGTAIPPNWYKNDSSTLNVRSVELDTDAEMYLVITDINGVRTSGNLRGKDATLTPGSVTTDILADGAVTMENLSPDIQSLLEKVKNL